MKIKVMADYGCYPLWRDDPGIYGNINPAELGISEDLQSALLAWAGRYEAILNQDDPANSAFATPAAEQIFHEDGRALTVRMAKELGPLHAVRYWHDRDATTAHS